MHGKERIQPSGFQGIQLVARDEYLEFDEDGSFWNKTKEVPDFGGVSIYGLSIHSILPGGQEAIFVRSSDANSEKVVLPYLFEENDWAGYYLLDIMTEGVRPMPNYRYVCEMLLPNEEILEGDIQFDKLPLVKFFGSTKAWQSIQDPDIKYNNLITPGGIDFLSQLRFKFKIVPLNT